MVNRHRRTSTAQVLKGGAGRSLPPLPIIGRASICPCPVGKADPALAHVPLVEALRYLACPCRLRPGLRMEVFGLSPTFHVSALVPPLLMFSSEWLAGSLRNLHLVRHGGARVGRTHVPQAVMDVRRRTFSGERFLDESRHRRPASRLTCMAGVGGTP